MMERFRRYLLQGAMSAVAVALALIHVAAPQVRIDSITLVLLAVAALPWLAPIFKSVQLPGGWGFEFQEFRHEVRQQLGQVRQRVEAVEKVVFSGDVAPEEVERLRAELARFHDYLVSRGLNLSGPPPEVHVGAEGMGAYYVPGENRISIDKRIASDPSVIFREYCHHALLASVASNDALLTEAYDLESGIAFYLPCSFLGDPRYGAAAAAALGRQESFIVDLDNHRLLSRRTSAVGPENWARAEVWGGVCWEVRGLLGAERADSLVVSCWRRTIGSRTRGDPEARFAGLLVELLPPDAPARSAQSVRALLQRRKVPRAGRRGGG